MPRCQRTFRRLPADAAVDAATDAPRFVCPFCADAETYAWVRDSDLTEYARLAYAQCVRDFGAPTDAAWTTRLLRGLRPECVREIDRRRYDLYLHAGSDAYQLRLQIGHEMFHRVCSMGVVFHWTHEMLACLVSVRLLRQFGAGEYAERMRERYRRDADVLPVKALLDADLRRPAANADEAAGVYGRAYVLGEALAEAAGWPALCRLARWGIVAEAPPPSKIAVFVRTVPDVFGWLRSLDAETATNCARILEITGDKRVQSEKN